MLKQNNNYQYKQKGLCPNHLSGAEGPYIDGTTIHRTGGRTPPALTPYFIQKRPQFLNGKCLRPHAEVVP